MGEKLTAAEIKERVRQFVGRRNWVYRQTFSGPLAQEVLRDLARFCRANVSTFHDNERVQSKLDGRREVWLRIQQHVQMTEDDLWKLLSGESDV